MPAPDAVTVALDKACELCRVITKTETVAGCHVLNCEIVRARTENAAKDGAVEAANLLLARIADEAASTQNTARRTEGQMPLIDCRLIADVFRYVGARRGGA
jgi:hypothetical protein